MTRKIVLFIVVLVLFLTACGQASSPDQTPVFTPTPPPLPESGKATIIGRVINGAVAKELKRKSAERESRGPEGDRQ